MDLQDNELIALGTKVNGSKVSAVLFTKGERYYMLTDKFGGVSLMPQTALNTQPQYK